MHWYSFIPVDTLFFKGAEPMNLGENHTASANFPPPVQTITGALRTAILLQNNISIEDFYNNNIDSNMLSLIGPADKEAGFCVTGPLFQLNNIIFVPAPYSWFIEKEDKNNLFVKVYKSSPLKSSLIKIASRNLLWAKGEKGELETIGGKWIPIAELHTESDSITRKETHDFFFVEPRTGIALEKNRRVRERHLYTFNHARLNKNVGIVFGVDKSLPIAENGILKLGAEQRFGAYKKVSPIDFKKGESGHFLSLSVVEGTKAANDAVIAAGKIQYIGGWDMKKGFHKPMKGYFPAGSVFNKKLNDNFIEL